MQQIVNMWRDKYFSIPNSCSSHWESQGGHAFEKASFLDTLKFRWTPELFSEISNSPAIQCCRNLYIKIVKRHTVLYLLGKMGDQIPQRSQSPVLVRNHKQETSTDSQWIVQFLIETFYSTLPLQHQQGSFSPLSSLWTDFQPLVIYLM